MEKEIERNIKDIRSNLIIANEITLTLVTYFKKIIKKVQYTDFYEILKWLDDEDYVYQYSSIKLYFMFFTESQFCNQLDTKNLLIKILSKKNLLFQNIFDDVIFKKLNINTRFELLYQCDKYQPNSSIMDLLARKSTTSFENTKDLNLNLIEVRQGIKIFIEYRRKLKILKFQDLMFIMKLECQKYICDEIKDFVVYTLFDCFKDLDYCKMFQPTHVSKKEFMIMMLGSDYQMDTPFARELLKYDKSILSFIKSKSLISDTCMTIKNFRKVSKSIVENSDIYFKNNQLKLSVLDDLYLSSKSLFTYQHLITLKAVLKYPEDKSYLFMSCPVQNKNNNIYYFDTFLQSFLSKQQYFFLKELFVSTYNIHSQRIFINQAQDFNSTIFSLFPVHNSLAYPLLDILISLMKLVDNRNDLIIFIQSHVSSEKSIRYKIQYMIRLVKIYELDDSLESFKLIVDLLMGPDMNISNIIKIEPDLDIKEMVVHQFNLIRNRKFIEQLPKTTREYIASYVYESIKHYLYSYENVQELIEFFKLESSIEAMDILNHILIQNLSLLHSDGRNEYFIGTFHSAGRNFINLMNTYFDEIKVTSRYTEFKPMVVLKVIQLFYKNLGQARFTKKLYTQCYKYIEPIITDLFNLRSKILQNLNIGDNIEFSSYYANIILVFLDITKVSMDYLPNIILLKEWYKAHSKSISDIISISIINRRFKSFLVKYKDVVNTDESSQEVVPRLSFIVYKLILEFLCKNHLSTSSVMRVSKDFFNITKTLIHNGTIGSNYHYIFRDVESIHSKWSLFNHTHKLIFLDYLSIQYFTLVDLVEIIPNIETIYIYYNNYQPPIYKFPSLKYIVLQFSREYNISFLTNNNQNVQILKRYNR